MLCTRRARLARAAVSLSPACPTQPTLVVAAVVTEQLDLQHHVMKLERELEAVGSGEAGGVAKAGGGMVEAAAAFAAALPPA